MYDLKAANPHREAATDTRTPAELLDLIEAKGVEISAACAALRAMTAGSPACAVVTSCL